MTESTINSTTPRVDVVDWPEGEFPEQMGGIRTTLMPGIYTFQLPQNLAALWHDLEITDNRPGSPTQGQKVVRQQLKFDRDNPLVVVGGDQEGLPLSTQFSTAPRPRGRKDDPKTQWISDVAYSFGVGLGDKRRPGSIAELQAAYNEYAGKVIRLEIGLSGYCNPNKVRRVQVETAEGTVVIEDPTGKKGCGARYYTKDFKLPEGGFGTEVICSKCVDASVLVTGYENVERILPPLGQ